MTPQIDRVRIILDDLESVQENLLALSDDIWLEIDHRDNTAIAEGTRFQQNYNSRLTDFRRLSDDIRELLTGYMQPSVELEVGTLDESDTEILRPVSDQSQRDARERHIKELDRYTPHSLDDHMTYKRPQGFALRDNIVSNATTWKKVLQAVCLQLHKADTSKFKNLHRNNTFMSNRGNRRFAQFPDTMISPLKLPEGLYVESNLSAKNTCELIKEILTEFNIGVDELKLYLREDRDA